MSASPPVMISLACAVSVIIPTAPVLIPASASNATGKGHLIAFTDRNTGLGHECTRRDVNQIDAEDFEIPRTRNRLVRIPAASFPVGRRNTHEEREAVGHQIPNRRRDPQNQPHPILQAASVRILALLIGERNS